MRAEEMVLRVPDGRSVAVLLNATLVHSEDGEVETFVVTMQDMAQLEELERLRAEFLAMVSYELRPPGHGQGLGVHAHGRVLRNASSRGQSVSTTTAWRALPFRSLRPTQLSPVSTGTSPRWAAIPSQVMVLLDAVIADLP